MENGPLSYPENGHLTIISMTIISMSMAWHGAARASGLARLVTMRRQRATGDGGEQDVFAFSSPPSLPAHCTRDTGRGVFHEGTFNLTPNFLTVVGGHLDVLCHVTS